MPKVLISDKLSEAAVQIFKDHKIDTAYMPGIKKEELLNIIDQYDGLAIRSATKVTEEIFNKATNLKIVGRAGIGTDNIDKIAATKNGIIVMNTPYGNAVTTAEHAIALMMSLVRMIPRADKSTREGKWEKSKFNGTEITGKYLGLIGCGNIGSIVANRAIGLKMKVLAFDPFLTKEKASELGVEKVELDYLLKNSDIISLHTPMTEDTKNIISSKAIGVMKKGSRIINCARGGIINEKALYDALTNKKIRAAGLDVYDDEPSTSSNPLFSLDNILLSPHIAGVTQEATIRMSKQAVQNVLDVFDNKVDPDVIINKNVL